ncbi:hypothetical protein [Demequina sp.]|uniref:hypothetical protein n=1 Tax=Demequina sp. TaxID=2050685 RepID=UPI003A8A3040
MSYEEEDDAQVEPRRPVPASRLLTIAGVIVGSVIVLWALRELLWRSWELADQYDAGRALVVWCYDLGLDVGLPVAAALAVAWWGLRRGHTLSLGQGDRSAVGARMVKVAIPIFAVVAVISLLGTEVTTRVWASTGLMWPTDLMMTVSMVLIPSVVTPVATALLAAGLVLRASVSDRSASEALSAP